MSKEITIVFFNRRNQRGAYGYHNGRCVYPHDNYPGTIKVDSLWICSLEMYGMSNTYFAIPIREAEVADILGLDSSNVKAVADFLIRDHPEAVSEILEKSGRTSRATINEERPEDDGIRYIGDDTLESTRFTDGHYDVCTSIDNTTLMVIPREFGRIPCIEHRLVSEGLDQILRSRIGKELAIEAFEGYIVIDLNEETYV